MAETLELKPLEWVGSAYKDYMDFPAKLRHDMGYALYLAQMGEQYESATVLKGCGDAQILELKGSHVGSTYRAVYTVRFDEVVYALHCFQKKSHRGKKTPQLDLELIKTRLRAAERMHRETYGKKK